MTTVAANVPGAEPPSDPPLQEIQDEAERFLALQKIREAGVDATRQINTTLREEAAQAKVMFLAQLAASIYSGHRADSILLDSTAVKDAAFEAAAYMLRKAEMYVLQAARTGVPKTPGT